jgi:ubiquinone biosynthesis protein
MGLKKEVRDIARASHVLEVAFKYGLGYLIEEAGLKMHLPFHKKVRPGKFAHPLTPEVKLREAFEELGGTYIKLGQLLSIRPDLVPAHVSNELKKLQDDVKPVSYVEIKTLVEKELGKPLDKVYKHFDITPIAAASIGQVHRAVLLNGKQVCVKVQRPNIDKIMHSDIDIMTYFARRYDKKNSDRMFSATRIVEEFQEYTEDELNYLVESKNMKVFHKNFEKDDHIVFPRPFMAYTTKKVLTMEYIEGEKLSDLLKSKKKFNRKKIGMRMANAVMKMIYIDGFFHSDIHPGNIFILPKDKIAFLDFGIVGSINANMKKHVVDMLVALAERDTERVTGLLVKIGERTDKTDMEKYRREVDNILGAWHGSALQEVKVSRMLHLLFDATTENHIRLPEFLILYGKAFVTLEATGHQLYPAFDPVKFVTPYVTKVVKDRYRVKNVLHDLAKKTRRAADMMEEFPADAMSIVDKLKSGKFKIDVEDIELKKIGLDIDTSSNRLAFGMIASAFILASAVIFGTSLGPTYYAYPIISIIMFGIGMLFLGLVLISVFREETL